MFRPLRVIFKWSLGTYFYITFLPYCFSFALVLLGQELHALPLTWGAQCSVFSILQHRDITDIHILIGNIAVKRRLIIILGYIP